MSDPFAFLRSLVPSSAGNSSVPADAGSASADAVGDDLFSGSEPVPATPENTPTVEASSLGVVDSSSTADVVAGAAPVAAPVASSATLPGDVLAAMQAALIDLDTRLHVVETYLHQNGVL